MRGIRLIFISALCALIGGTSVLAMNVHATAASGGGVAGAVNAQRSASGMGGLSYNSSLAYAAQLRAQDMIDNDYWSHTSPSGLGMSYFLGQSGYPYYTAGENLSRGYVADESVVSAWMNSSNHRSAMLSASFSDLGVGVASGLLGTEPTTIVVAYFGAQSPINNVQNPAPAPVPVPVPTTEPSIPQPRVDNVPVTQPEPIQVPEPVSNVQETPPTSEISQTMATYELTEQPYLISVTKCERYRLCIVSSELIDFGLDFSDLLANSEIVK